MNSTLPQEVIIRPIAESDRPLLKPLWLSLFEYERALGGEFNLPTDAFELWMSSFAGTLDRFAFIFIAEAEGEVVGFLAGRIRVHPKHFGGAQVGYLTEMLVSESHRRRGIATSFLSTAKKWFHERGIDQIHLPVFYHNRQAYNLYERMGWAPRVIELISSSHET